MEVFILTETDTVTDVNGFQTHFIALSLGLCQCERTNWVNSDFTKKKTLGKVYTPYGLYNAVTAVMKLQVKCADS